MTALLISEDRCITVTRVFADRAFASVAINSVVSVRQFVSSVIFY